MIKGNKLSCEEEYFKSIVFVFLISFVDIKEVHPRSKSSYVRSQEDKKAGRLEEFTSSEEMFQSLGI